MSEINILDLNAIPNFKAKVITRLVLSTFYLLILFISIYLTFEFSMLKMFPDKVNILEKYQGESEKLSSLFWSRLITLILFVLIFYNIKGYNYKLSRNLVLFMPCLILLTGNIITGVSLLGYDIFILSAFFTIQAFLIPAFHYFDEGESDFEMISSGIVNIILFVFFDIIINTFVISSSEVYKMNFNQNLLESILIKLPFFVCILFAFCFKIVYTKQLDYIFDYLKKIN